MNDFRDLRPFPPRRSLGTATGRMAAQIRGRWTSTWILLSRQPRWSSSSRAECNYR